MLAKILGCYKVQTHNHVLVWAILCSDIRYVLTRARAPYQGKRRTKYLVVMENIFHGHTFADDMKFDLKVCICPRAAPGTHSVTPAGTAHTQGKKGTAKGGRHDEHLLQWTECVQGIVFARACELLMRLRVQGLSAACHGAVQEAHQHERAGVNACTHASVCLYQRSTRALLGRHELLGPRGGCRLLHSRGRRPAERQACHGHH